MDSLKFKPAFLGLLVLLFLSACSTLSRKKAAPAPAEVGVSKPVLVGTVAMVNAELQFVLIETGRSAAPEVGQALKCFSQEGESAIVTVSPESHRPFISADIVRGEPHQGDEVFQ